MVTPVKKVPIHLQSAANRLLIKGASIVNHDGVTQADVYVEDTKIKQVGTHLIIPGGTRVIEAAGKYILPGGIDVNVHLQMPTKTDVNPEGTVTIDNFYQGTKAAIAGGTTMVVDTVIPDEGETLEEAYTKWRGWAEDQACCDYALKVALPSKVDNVVLSEMETLAGQDYGVNTFQLDMIGARQMNDADMVAAMTQIGRLGGLAQVHAQSGDIVKRNAKRVLDKGITGPEGLAMAHTEAAEEEAVMRATTLASQVGCPIQVNHCMSGGAADLIKYKKTKGAVIFGEVTPAALGCDGEEYWNKCWRHAAGFTCSPPLRKGQRDKLLEGVVDNTLDLVASHHATYNAKQKALGIRDFTKIPPGVNGVEARMSLLWELGVHSGKMSPEKFVAATSAIPAKMLGVYPQKGRVAVGSQADLVIWDPSATRTISKENHNLKVDFNIFEGTQCHGVPETVLVQGKLMVDEGRVRVMQGFGKFVALEPSPQFVYDQVRAKAEADADLASAQPVSRSGADMELPASVTNGSNGTKESNGGSGDGSSEDIPSPAPRKSDQPERAPSQQSSNFDLKDHPNAPDDSDSQYRNSPQRASVRVRAPPGGRSSGGFW